MTETTIADIPREKTVIDSTDWFEGQDGGGSFKAHVGGIRGLGVLDVTTAAVSQDITPVAKVVSITTGGTAGQELLNLTAPALGPNDINTDYLGTRVYFVLNTQTDPGDSVKITVDGLAYCGLYIPENTIGVTRYNTIILNFTGACVCFVWCGDKWRLDSESTDGNFSGTYRVDQVNIGPQPVTGSQGQPLTLDAGQGDTPGLIKMGSVVPLPESDPLVLWALFTDGPLVAGVPMPLMISAGPSE
jgi:hypothetical protein